MNTIIIIAAIVIVLVIVYKLISNNYTKRMSLINKGLSDIKLNGYAIVEVDPALFVTTLQQEEYETYMSPMSLGFILEGNEVLVMPTVKKNSLAILVSTMGDMDESKLEALVEDNWRF